FRERLNSTTYAKVMRWNSKWGLAAHPGECTRETPLAVPAHHFRVGRRVQAFAPHEPADQRVLREEVFRAPEPVCVPAPDEILCGEPVRLFFADRAVVDVFEGVVARVRRLVGEAAERDEHLLSGEHGPVDEIGFLGAAARLEVLEIALRIGM